MFTKTLSLQIIFAAQFSNTYFLEHAVAVRSILVMESLVIEKEQEAPTRMKISHCINIFTCFF